MWDAIYNFLGIKDFIYFISSAELQDKLLYPKLVFISFAMFFLAAVIYFLVNSSYLHYKFLEDVTEFLSWHAYGLREISIRWKKIQKRIESGAEADYKLAIIEADDFLNQLLDEAGFSGKSFEELLKNASKSIALNEDELVKVHNIRNSIVYQPDYKVDLEETKRILQIYEKTVKNIGSV